MGEHHYWNIHWVTYEKIGWHIIDPMPTVHTMCLPVAGILNCVRFPFHSLLVTQIFTWSTRDMMENPQNSLAIARKYVTADVFLTMTINPNWKEVKDALFPGQTPWDRPDLVARVFHLKKEEMIRCIIKDHILGFTLSWVHTIEFQTLGLPHMHFLIWVDWDSKIITLENVDSLISPAFQD